MELIKTETIQHKIHTIREVQIILDKDLAQFYGVKPIRLREQIKRNPNRFPPDFVFPLSETEIEYMVSQNAIPSKQSLGGSFPLVFTEQGTAWVPDELQRLDHFFQRMGGSSGSQEEAWGAEVVGKLSLKPSEYFARQGHVGASFIRRAEVQIRDRVGVDRIMWGSDYPHREASSPYSKECLAHTFGGVPKADVEKMLSLNAAKLYGFDLNFLRPIADRIGPKVDDVFAGLAPRILPTDANMCPAFADYEFATE